MLLALAATWPGTAQPAQRKEEEEEEAQQQAHSPQHQQGPQEQEQPRQISSSTRLVEGAVTPAPAFQLTLAHCDHGWRADSAMNAAHVAGLAHAWGVPCLQRAAPDPSAIRKEAAARAWRYGALAEMAREAGCGVVATGHTATDRAETQLLNLLRGAGVRGLSALRWDVALPLGPQAADERVQEEQGAGPAAAATGHGSSEGSKRGTGGRSTRASGGAAGTQQQQHQLRLVRPLLGVRREHTATACAALGLAPWEDATNADPGVSKRNRVRLELMPLLRAALGPGVDGELERRSWRMERAAQRLAGAAHAWLGCAGNVVHGPPPRVEGRAAATSGTRRAGAPSAASPSAAAAAGAAGLPGPDEASPKTSSAAVLLALSRYVWVVTHIGALWAISASRGCMRAA